jgi:hypothetical protein
LKSGVSVGPSSIAINNKRYHFGRGLFNFIHQAYGGGENYNSPAYVSEPSQFQLIPVPGVFS